MDIMKRYKASATIEATVILPTAALIVIYLIMLSLYVTDEVVAKNAAIISAIRCEEEYYHYSTKVDDEWAVDIDSKLSECYTSNRVLSTVGFKDKLEMILAATDVNATDISKSSNGVTLEGYLDFKPQSKILNYIRIKVKIVNHNDAEFIRNINSLCKEVFRQ